jgi:multidrug efflux pump subunit AcrB
MDELENRLRRIESVSKLRHYGLEKEQISIYLEKEKLTNTASGPRLCWEAFSRRGLQP